MTAQSTDPPQHASVGQRILAGAGRGASFGAAAGLIELHATYLTTDCADLTATLAVPLYDAAGFALPGAALGLVRGGSRGGAAPVWEAQPGTHRDGTAPTVRVLAVARAIGRFGDSIVPLFRGTGQPHRQPILEVVQSALLAGTVWYLTGRDGVVGAALDGLTGFAVAAALSVGPVAAILWAADRLLTLGLARDLLQVFPQFGTPRRPAAAGADPRKVG